MSTSVEAWADNHGEIPAGVRKRYFTITLLLCALGFAAVGLFPKLFYTVFTQHHYLIFHTVLEFTSIVISFAVFVIGWYGYQQNGSKRDLFIGVVFLMVGLTDFAHMLSFDGMPAFLSPNSVSKAATYWIAARLTDAAGLFAAAFIVNNRSKWLTPAILAPLGLAAVAAVVIVVSWYPNYIPAMFITGQGLTPLKIYLEWVVIALYAGAIYAFGMRQNRDYNTVWLQMALVVVIFSELSFTLYASAYDTYNMIGHVYKLIAFSLIFKALFVSSFQKPYAELLKARDQVEQSFARIGVALAASLELHRTLELIAELASDMLGSRHAAVMMLRDGELEIEAQRGLADYPARISPEHTAAGEAVETRKPVAVADVTADSDHRADCHCQRLKGAKARSVASAPIVWDRDILGAVEVYSPKVHAFGPRECELLSTFARQAAIAIRNSLAYERERKVAETLQRSLLPPVPTVPGIDIAVQYLPADDVAKVGGDLYDVYPLTENHLAILVGDVCGHGVEAASLTAMTVFTIKSLLMQGNTPGETLRLANDVLYRSSDDELRFVTAFLGVLDLGTHRLQYANAGHHMPVAIDVNGCQYVELRAGLPLMVMDSTEYQTHEVDLKGASGLLLYTDGIVEARNHGEFLGEDRLRKLCDRMKSCSAQEMLKEIVFETRQWSGNLQDDIVVLALRWSDGV